MRRSASALGLLAMAMVACERGQPSVAPPVARVADGGSSSTTGTSATTRQPFVVGIVVDQLSAWVASSRLPELPKDGGFARLMREGTWVKTMRYAHGVTDTGPGHASLYTGKVPAESGLFGNDVPNAAGDRVSVLRDPAFKAVAADGVRPVAGWSAAALRIDNVADRLRAARPDALVVSVSVKERGAILPAGKHPSYALWFDAALDSYVTSTAFAQTYPKWAIGVGDTKAVVAARSKTWELTDPAWVRAHATTPDAQPGEGDLDGLGITFPHVAKTAAAFRLLPASDEMTIRLGLAAIEAEYDPSRPTLLLLSLSSCDLLGHVFGPDSWEAWDQLRKLDGMLAMLLDTLDRKVGAPVQVVLAADHGNISLPELAAARPGCARPPNVPPATPTPHGWPCTPGERLMPNALRDELLAATKSALGPGRWIAGFADPYVYLTPEARALPADRLALLDKTVRATLAKHAIAEILDTKMLAVKCPAVLASAEPMPARATAANRDSLLTFVCRSWSPGAGDYYVVPAPGSFFGGEIVLGKGTSHGTPYLHDRTVPLLVRAPGAIDAGAVIDDPVDFSVFAALEAAFLGLDKRAPREILDAHRAGPTQARTP